MPRGDRTGPRGAGPRTGRGLGNCLPGSVQGQPTPTGGGLGRGLGPRGLGRGRGRRNRWFQPNINTPNN